MNHAASSTKTPLSSPDLFEFVPPPREKTLVERFVEFHEANPTVYIALVTLARKMLARGKKRYGIAGLVEVARWHRTMETSGDEYKINNSFRSFYARLIMHHCKDLEGFFEVRDAQEFHPETVKVPYFK